MCTVLLRFEPTSPWPIVAGAIRDEFADRSWDAPARHWESPWDQLLGGRDRTAGGTWLAVDPHRPALAALLNGPRRVPPVDGRPRPTRGDLALRLLASGDLPADLTDHDRFHLVGAALDRVDVWSWDAEELHHQVLEPGEHIVVNLGLDAADDPLVPHFAPLLASLPEPGTDLAGSWPAWVELLSGDRLHPTDERALVVDREVEGRRYASTSASLVALSRQEVRYSFTDRPADPTSWYDVLP